MGRAALQKSDDCRRCVIGSVDVVGGIDISLTPVRNLLLSLGLSCFCWKNPS